MTSEDTPKPTSSQGSADGRSPFDWPDGLTIDLFGQVRARVKLSQARLEAEMSQTICGPTGIPSSLQIALEKSLASRLPLKSIGLMASAMTWMHWVTLSGRRFFRLSVSAKTMRALGFTLRATPTATANQASPSMAKWVGCAGIEVTPQTWCQRMGFPAEWLSCAPSATPSSHKSRQSLSQRSRKST